MVIRAPMRRHYKSRTPALNVCRLDEVVSTDTMFANCSSLFHGYRGFQVYWGLVSHCINVYGIKSKGEFPRTYRDFIREEGAPSALRRDNASEETSKEVLDINRDYMVKDQDSEPHNQHQNLVESQAVKWLKQTSHVLLDHTGAPESAYFLAVAYLAEVHNICFDPRLGMTPLQKRTGVTPDISPYL